jgi:hypothetical protein
MTRPHESVSNFANVNTSSTANAEPAQTVDENPLVPLAPRSFPKLTRLGHPLTTCISPVPGLGTMGIGSHGLSNFCGY